MWNSVRDYDGLRRGSFDMFPTDSGGHTKFLSGKPRKSGIWGILGQKVENQGRDVEKWSDLGY